MGAAESTNSAKEEAKESTNSAKAEAKESTNSGKGEKEVKSQTKSKTVETTESKAEELTPDTDFTVFEVEMLLSAWKNAGFSEDKKISRSKFLKVMKGIGSDIPYPALKEESFHSFLFELFDVDNSGSIDIKEFLNGISVLANGTVEDKSALVFRTLDVDGDGVLSKAELEHGFRKGVSCAQKLLWAQFLSLAKAQGTKSYVATASAVNELYQRYKPSQSAFDDMLLEFYEIDEDQNGRISLEEWTKAVKENPKMNHFFNVVVGNNLSDFKQMKDFADEANVLKQCPVVTSAQLDMIQKKQEERKAAAKNDV